MIRIPRAIYSQIIEHARRESPLECCGILGGKEERVEKSFELRNAEESATRYSISPSDQWRVFQELESNSAEMMAVYHSHPATIPFPSETDVRMAFYPEVSTIIISLKEAKPIVKAFRIGNETIVSEEIDIVE